MILLYHTNASLFFFFSSRRRHTRLQGDWSSDVCSSDLADEQRNDEHTRRGNGRQYLLYLRLLLPKRFAHLGENSAPPQFRRVLINRRQIGRASCRERV